MRDSQPGHDSGRHGGEDTDLLQADTLRKDEAELWDAADAVGEAGFSWAWSWGEAASPSREDSSRERLRPVIRAHGKMTEETGLAVAIAVAVPPRSSK